MGTGLFIIDNVIPVTTKIKMLIFTCNLNVFDVAPISLLVSFPEIYLAFGININNINAIPPIQYTDAIVCNQYINVFKMSIILLALVYFKIKKESNLLSLC
jgi:hypothetical protein